MQQTEQPNRNINWCQAMIEAFEERAALCNCPFEAYKMKQEAENYRKMKQNLENQQ